MKILLIRHGEPDYERDSLTPKGFREAEILANRLCREPADAYYVSPLGRARDTARPTLERLGRRAETLDWLQEFRARIVDPRTGEKRIIWDLMPQYWTRSAACLDRERWLQDPLVQTGDSEIVYRETVEGLDRLLHQHGYDREGMLYKTRCNSRKTLVLFCHFGISCMILSHLLGISPMILLHGLITPPTSVTTLITEERLPGEVWFRLTGLGDVTHLHEAGEPVALSGRFGECYEDGYATHPYVKTPADAISMTIQEDTL